MESVLSLINRKFMYTIGQRVIRTKGEKYQINDKGTIIDTNILTPDRFRIKWDGGVRTWLNKNSFSILEP